MARDTLGLDRCRIGLATGASANSIMSVLILSLGGGQTHAKRASPSEGGAQFHLASQRTDGLRNDRKPDTCTRIGILGMQALEDLEDPPMVLYSDSDTVVHDTDNYLPTLDDRGQPNPRGTLGTSVDQSVFHQVAQDLADQGGVPTRSCQRLLHR